MAGSNTRFSNPYFLNYYTEHASGSVRLIYKNQIHTLWIVCIDKAADFSAI